MIHSPIQDVWIPDNIPLSKYILDGATKHGDRVAMVDLHSNKQITFREIITQSRALGSALWRQGFRQGDVMMMYSPNCIEYAVMFHAVIGQGGIISTCSHMFNSGELLSQMEDSASKFVFTHKHLLANVEEARRKHKLKGVVTADGAPDTWSYTELLRDDGMAFPDVKIDVRNDVAVLPYSSGTTGKPKGVMLTHYNLVTSMIFMRHPEIGAVVGGSRLVFAMPFAHIYGIIIILCSALREGSFVALLRQYSLQAFLGAVQKYKGDFLYTVPPIIIQLAKDPVVSEYDLSSVTQIYCGAAPLTKEVIIATRRRFPHIQSIGNGYGMTELSPLALSTRPATWDYGAVGIPVPNTTVKVVDPVTKKTLGTNQNGEIAVKGPQVMKGYLANRVATSATIDEHGWLYTGDLGHYDKNGIFYVVDRLKDLIKYKAHQVAPAELEDFLLQLPGVADAAVIGVPDEKAGELPRAFVIRKQGALLSEAEVINHIRKQGSPYKQLHGGVQFVDTIPKSPSGKILRRLIRDQYGEKLSTVSKL